MKIILLQDVENLGTAGDTVEVRGGYFRNFLSPKKLAVNVTEGGLRFLEARRKKALLKSQQLKEEALANAKKLGELTCIIKARVGEEGKLFGSVTTHHVHEELERNGFSLDRKRIEMAPIHKIGEYNAKIKLHPEVDVALKVFVKA